MAGDWIKMRCNLWDDPRVAKIVDITDSSEAAVIGALYWLWSTGDQHTENGILPGMTIKSIDRKTGVSGFADALIAIDWIADHPDGICIVDFEKHNGKSAKKRCQTAKRVANYYSTNADITQEKENTSAHSVSDALAREEKRREEIREPKGSSSAKLPSCPHVEIIDLFGQHLPELPQPQPELWNGARAKALQARWKWILTAKKRDGERYAENAEQAIAFLVRYFEYVAKSDFLTGRSGKFTGCDLGWLVNETNFSKVLQGNYENQKAGQ